MCVDTGKLAGEKLNLHKITNLKEIFLKNKLNLKFDITLRIL